jgi:hypothetical protein
LQGKLLGILTEPWVALTKNSQPVENHKRLDLYLRVKEFYYAMTIQSLREIFVAMHKSMAR